MASIRLWVFHVNQSEYQASSMMLSQQCVKWVCSSKVPITKLSDQILSDMSVEGIFRKNGNIRRLKDLCDTIDRDPSGVDLTTDNPVQLAALLKKFLRDLPDPLFTFKLQRLFISTLCKLQRNRCCIDPD
jgi:hypothetical protein